MVRSSLQLICTTLHIFDLRFDPVWILIVCLCSWRNDTVALALDACQSPLQYIGLHDLSCGVEPDRISKLDTRVSDNLRRLNRRI